MWGLGILPQCRFFDQIHRLLQFFGIKDLEKNSEKHFLTLESPKNDSEYNFWVSRMLKMLIFWASRILKNILKFLGFKDSEKDSESIFWASRVLKRILNSIFGRQRSWNGFRMHILSLESHKNDSEYKFWVSIILKKIQNAILGLFDLWEPWKGFWIAFSELEEFSLNAISHAKLKKTVSEYLLTFPHQ